MKTTDTLNEQTEVLINWSDFEQAKFLSDVDVLVSSEVTIGSPGTSLYITATKEKYYQWNRSELASLTNELRKLKSPFTIEEQAFTINLGFIDCPYSEYNDHVFEIESYKITELYDYRISGSISGNGEVEAEYQNNVESSLPSQIIEFEMELSPNNYCGKIEFDFRVFDRDSEAIGNLIGKGLIDPVSKLAIGKRDAKRLLDEAYGVNVYREGFRVRPYGNGGIDWLNLDKDRIQNPSQKISNNQVIGYVNIKPEEFSFLKEKSGRDGLKEDSHYFGLVTRLKSIINQLEERRFEYRYKTGRGRKTKNINQEIEILFDYTALTNEVSKKLNHLKIDDKIVNEVAAIIHKDAERKTKLLENIQNTIAIYQGQATLGKIVTVLLHEGRKPILYFQKQSPNLTRWLKHYKSKGNWEDANRWRGHREIKRKYNCPSF